MNMDRRTTRSCGRRLSSTNYDHNALATLLAAYNGIGFGSQTSSRNKDVQERRSMAAVFDAQCAKGDSLRSGS